ncbi:MAG: hypothetical protein AAB354_09830 [candidate division KSB1 bacterium]
MEDSLGNFFAIILVSFLLGIGGYVIFSLRKRLFLASFPTGEKRKTIMSELARMKQENQARTDMLKYLRQQGLDKSVANLLAGEAERKFQREHGGAQAASGRGMEAKPPVSAQRGHKNAEQLRLHSQV